MRLQTLHPGVEKHAREVHIRTVEVSGIDSERSGVRRRRKLSKPCYRPRDRIAAKQKGELESSVGCCPPVVSCVGPLRNDGETARRRN